MPIELTWIGHASFRVAGRRVVYLDPWKVPAAPYDGDLVFVSHSHHDHCSSEDVAKVRKSTGEVVGPASAIAQLGLGRVVSPGQKLTLGGVDLETTRAYNPGKKFHPRENDWMGVVLTLDGMRVYFAGDTDLIPEMGELRNIDVALLPVGGTYTMTGSEAAEACARIRPALAIPCHWGDVVGHRAEAEALAAGAGCKVRLLAPGETLALG